MAEGKKSFVLYVDQISLLEKLSIKQRGELMTLIFDYVNDKHPPASKDFGVDLVFHQFVLQFKRDLKKWEHRREVNIKNGKQGGRPSEQETKRERRRL